MGKRVGGARGHVAAVTAFGGERKLIGVEDLVLLTSVSEKSILENLKVRHAADEIYSYIGHVLVVVNPYKWLPIYDESSMKAYALKSRIDVPPHVFATAEEAYRTMISEEDNQCVIISGESGAGKTEASKQIQNYIAGVSGSGDGVDKVKRTFLESNPLLEAFGNAKTLRNNNSSRFGKYFELLFDSAGRPQGGKVTNYLLEKSRVVRPGKGERNFHIFYQLLAGLPPNAKQKLYLDQVDNFRYLSVSGCFRVDDVDDAQEFEATMQAMQHVGIKRKQMELVLQMVAAILHLGNVDFAAQQVGDAEGSCIRDTYALEVFCALMGLDAKQLEHALCFKLLQTMAPGGQIENYQVPQNPTQAQTQRDAMAKHLFDHLFDFLVERINSALDIDKKAEKNGQLLLLDKDKLHTIGILDIYGFEIFDNNGFEQFCINYVNEKLQQIFIQLTLKSEQEEYEREGIAWKPIPFFNNQVVCELIDGKRPVPGLFLILDDTVKTMHSREGESIDVMFLEKVAAFHQQHPHFSKRGRNFEIKHYAGDVRYRIDGFGESNKDFLSKEIRAQLHDSSNKLVRYLFPEEIDFNDKRMPQTVGYKIRTQCEALVQALMECTPHYVRCIKSNDQKQANRFDDRRVIHQIQYLGLLENIKVRRAGYAYRGEYGRFVDRFRLLSKETFPDLRLSDKKGCQAILRAAVKSLPALEREVQMGKTMVFIQTPETFFALEKLREHKLSSFAIKIQKCWKRFSGRRHLLTLNHEMTKLYQKHNKQRQRVSIYRPFDRDYLRDDELRENLMEIVRHHGDSEKILFLDWVEKACSLNRSSQPDEVLPLRKRVLLLTDQYLYLFEQAPYEFLPTKEDKNPWTPPPVSLRRRIPVRSLEGVILSTLADPYFVLKVRPQNPMLEPDKSNWVDDKLALFCTETGKKFGLFHRRHHCRYTGKVYSNEVCHRMSVVPDRGYYTPVRVFNGSLGLFSTEMLEDQLLLSEKKTELVVTIADLLRSLTNQVIPITFQDSFRLQTALVPQLSNSPSQLISFVGSSSQHTFANGNREQITIHVPPGVPEEYIRKRRKREKARRRRLEKQREEEMALRAIRQAEREQQREADRARRIAEKKAKKQAEKEARRMSSASRKSSASNPENPRKFGERILPAASTANGFGVGANSELAAILARRRGGGASD